MEPTVRPSMVDDQNWWTRWSTPQSSALSRRAGSRVRSPPGAVCTAGCRSLPAYQLVDDARLGDLLALHLVLVDGAAGDLARGVELQRLGDAGVAVGVQVGVDGRARRRPGLDGGQDEVGHVVGLGRVDGGIAVEGRLVAGDEAGRLGIGRGIGAGAGEVGALRGLAPHVDDLLVL